VTHCHQRERAPAVTCQDKCIGVNQGWRIFGELEALERLLVAGD